jgi:branched-subunit amino acid transport protein AzlD
VVVVVVVVVVVIDYFYGYFLLPRNFHPDFTRAYSLYLPISVLHYSIVVLWIDPRGKFRD